MRYAQSVYYDSSEAKITTTKEIFTLFSPQISTNPIPNKDGSCNNSNLSHKKVNHQLENYCVPNMITHAFRLLAQGDKDITDAIIKTQITKDRVYWTDTYFSISTPNPITAKVHVIPLQSNDFDAGSIERMVKAQYSFPF